MKTKTDLERKVWYKILKIVYYVIVLLAYMLFGNIFKDCGDSQIGICSTIGKFLFIIGFVIITLIVAELLQRIVYYISLGSFNPPRN